MSAGCEEIFAWKEDVKRMNELDMNEYEKVTQSNIKGNFERWLFRDETLAW